MTCGGLRCPNVKIKKARFGQDILIIPLDFFEKKVYAMKWRQRTERRLFSVSGGQRLSGRAAERNSKEHERSK